MIRMSAPPPQFDAATRNQVATADPTVSAWVTANAGSGKTRALTNRVARLLVDGVAPERILCITYTNAAANEMSHRLMEIFSRWTMLPETALRDELTQIGVDPATITDRTLALCRTLLARLVDPGGGLNLSTVHSFAAALLRRFPLEASVSPRFGVVDDRGQGDLLTSILSGLADAKPALFADICAFAGEKAFETLVLDIMQNARAFAMPPSQELRTLLHSHDGPGLPEAPPGTCQAVRTLLADCHAWNDRIHQEMFTDEDRALLETFRSHLETGGVQDRKKAAKLARVLAEINEESFEQVCTLFLDLGSIPRIRLRPANKSTMDAMESSLRAGLLDYANRLLTMKTTKSLGITAQRTVACHRFADALLESLAAYQVATGSLFYDDLLMKLHSLLADQQIADWVLYRLDASIEHILVDEAQDMNDRNWDIIGQLSEEFTTGSGQHDGGPRTIFAVGDAKQSIFGFRGANPKRFMDMHDHYESRYTASGQQFLRCALDHSFRSSPAVLALVQAVLEMTDSDVFADCEPHRAFHKDMPGRVDLLDFIEPERTQEDKTLYDRDQVPPAAPFDSVSDYARRLVAVIRKALASTIPTKDGPRKAEPGDILILVQTRGGLYDALTRELHQSKIPYAGADRLNLADQIVTKDLMALLAYLACGQDDLALACVLRSPLCDVSEDDLFSLAHGREGALGEELRSRADETTGFRQADAFLRDLLIMENGHKPYDVLERVLTVHDGMQKFQARMGAQAAEAIEILLDQALLYEQSNETSLTGFIEWLDPQSIDVARKMSQQTNAVKVMTVHGAKGLEAPIVILPDTAYRPNPMSSGLFFDTMFPPIWIEKDLLPAGDYRELWQREEASRDEEKLCLMYVAMTRAECWLIVGGVGKMSTHQDSSPGKEWYATIDRAMRQLPTAPIEYRFNPQSTEMAFTARRYATGQWPQEVESRPGTPSQTPPMARPDWLTTPPAPPMVPPPILTPSQLADPDPQLTETGLRHGIDAAREGTLIHRLLEVLPGIAPSDRNDLADQIIRSEAPDLPAERSADIVASCRTLLEMPDLAMIFAADALSEVPVTARLSRLDMVPMYGIIDKLVILDDTVLAVDFKSHSRPPTSPEDIPTKILRQMGVYRYALEQMYPGHAIEIAILWTKSCQMMMVPCTLTEDALAGLELE